MDDQLRNTFTKTSHNSCWSIPVWIVVFLGLISLLQFYVPYPVQDDTAYHFAVGQLIKKYGILHAFPWTPFSTQFDHFADKEFFFHLLFVPIEGLGFVTASRIVGVVAGAAILTSLYFVLRAEHVEFAGLWAILPLASSAFVYRLAQVRPHLLSITLAIILIWAVARERLRILAVIAIIYPLSYVAFWQIPLMLLIAVEGALFFAGGRIRWKPAVTLLIGIIVGVLLHPNTFNLIRLNWIHMSDILFQGAWGHGKLAATLGAEINPYSIVEWGKFLIVCVLMIFTALVISWRDRQKSSIPFAFAIGSAVFGLLTIKSNRFLEYFVPLTVLAFAVTMRSRKRILIALMLTVSLLYTITFGTEPFKILAAQRAFIEPSVVHYFRQEIPIGSQVFTCGWDYTGNLMLALPERRFIVAEDPTLFYKKDPMLYDAWCRVPLEAPIDSAEAIRQLFKSRFVICKTYQAFWPFFDTLDRDPTVKILFADDKWVFFDLGEFSTGIP